MQPPRKATEKFPETCEVAPPLTYNQSLALEILNRTVWTNKKANQLNMNDINNIIVDEACSKCGEAENTDHMILECSYYSEKNWSCFQQLSKHKDVYTSRNKQKESIVAALKHPVI